MKRAQVCMRGCKTIEVILQSFLQHHFRQATYILNSTEPIASNMPWIEETKPDVVMIEVVERSLLYLDVLLPD